MGDNNIVYAFQFCPCIYESVWGTISLHRTERGAQMAMEFHKKDSLEEWGEDPSFDWQVQELKIEE